MHARTFLCREALWEAFEEIAREQRAPIDDVVSEAMRAYAHHRSYGGATGEEPNGGANAHGYDDDVDDLARTAARPEARATPSRRPPSLSPPTSRQGAGSLPRGMAPPHSAPPRGYPPDAPTHIATQRPFTQPLGQTVPAPPPRSSAQRLARGAAQMPAPHSRGIGPPPRSQPPPLPGSAPYVPAANPYAQEHGRVATRLSLTYLGQTVEVTTERFMLGRSKSQADLVLDDPNVSRQHAAIERVGNTWVLADLGSTNGCYVGGERITRHQLVDGDIIDITSHEVRCTLR